MDVTNIRIVAMDLDGTLTQHKEPLTPANRKALDALAKQYTLLMVGAGQVGRIFAQMERYPVSIVGNYGLQYGVYNAGTGEIDLVRDLTLACDRERVAARVEARVEALRKKYGYTDYAGESVEFHPSGCITFPLLGTKARQEDKLSFDPDRSRRRKIYDDVAAVFDEYCVFVGGSSSFDMAPRPYNKYYALDQYCREQQVKHENVVYIGDDYGKGGNDESVYRSDFPFITIDDYRTFPERVKNLIKD